MTEISKGLGKASQLASGLGSRTKDYFGSARANFTRPVFKPQAKPRRRKALKIDGREAAVIVLSVVGLAEVGWIGCSVTNPPPPAVVVNPGVKSSSASTVVPAQTTPAPRTKSAPSTARPKSSATVAPAPATQRTVASPAAKDSSPEPVKSATAGSPAGWVTIASSIPVDVFERGKKLAVRSGRVLLPAGPHDLEFRNRSLGIETRRTVEVVGNNEASVSLSVEPGSVNVNALPWASVIIDGAPVGDTPLANLPLSAGPHDVLFKHPELGERRVRVTVTPGTPLRVSTDLRKE
jgi:hypothetical protein